jgi:hypothetical protein
MVTVDRSEPADIVDGLLWRDAQRLFRQHAEPDSVDCCVWCGSRWPCASRRLAEQAEAAARRPWREAWTLRHDLNSIRAMSGLRAGLEGNGGGRQQSPVPRRRVGVNQRYFE